MFEVMSRHYEQIKDNLGLDEALAPSSEDEKDNYIGKQIEHELNTRII